MLLLRRLRGVGFFAVWLLLASCSVDDTETRTRCDNDRDCANGVCENGFCFSLPTSVDQGGTNPDSGQDVSNFDLGERDVAPGDVTTSDVERDPRVDSGRGEDLRRDPPLPDQSRNACGGIAALAGAPGSECGPCGGGVWECNGTELVDCVSPRAVNGCGGCSDLAGEPRTACNACDDGLWVCESDESVTCNCPEPEPNGTCAAPFPLLNGESNVRLVDLCGRGDETRAIASENCGGQTIDGEDVVYVFTLESTTTITAQLRDADDSVGVDTILYIRRACDDPASQVACHDDSVCTESAAELGTCVGEFQPRLSTITRSLDAGTYYLIADSFNVSTNGQTFECGAVRLVVEGL